MGLMLAMGVSLFGHHASGISLEYPAKVRKYPWELGAWKFMEFNDNDTIRVERKREFQNDDN